MFLCCVSCLVLDFGMFARIHCLNLDLGGFWDFRMVAHIHCLNLDLGDLLILGWLRAFIV
jgi:hypothetical protein